MLSAVLIGLHGTLSKDAFANDEKLKYDVWISPNYLGAVAPAPPYAPFHDCLIVQNIGGSLTIMLTRFPPAGAAWIRPGTIEAFGGTTGLNIYILGWYINSAAFPWAPLDTIGGIMGSPRKGKTWGFAGVRNDACTP